MRSISNIDKQVVAFEIMSQPLEEIQFSDNFFDNLLDELSILKSPQAFVKDSEMNSSILPIKILRELVTKIRKRSHLSANESTLLTNLMAFLKQFQFAKTLKKYFNEKVYTSIYLSCFDPVLFTELSPVQVRVDVNVVDSFFLTEIESSPSLWELLKQENRNKIIKITNDLFELHSRWNKIVDEDNTDTSFLEKELQNELQHDRCRLGLCKVIFMDLNLKTKKSILLLKEWLECFKKWCNGNSHTGELNHDLLKRVNDIKKSVEKLSDDIRTLESFIKHIKRDNQSLESKENSLMQYVNRKEDVIKLRDSVNSEYETLLARRSEMIVLLNSAITGTLKYEKLSHDICTIEEEINGKFMELKKLNYMVYLSQQDSNEMIISLKDFARWLDSGREILQEKEAELVAKRKEKIKLEAFFEEVYQNIYRIKSIVGLKIGDLSSFFEETSESNLRPITSDTYTIDENNTRFKDMNMIGPDQ